MKLPSREQLKKEYIDNNKTSYELANELGYCQATIINLLKTYNIPRRNTGIRAPKVPSRDFLIKEYVQNRLSTWKIERLYGYSRSTVYRKLKEYKIDTRTLAESNRVYPRKSFSGNKIEKAYLIGFRLGDLRVRKICKNSETISVDCGSTKPEQIRLIRNLFENYGNIWTSQTKTKVQIEVHLNLSFSFLLIKDIPYWVLCSRGCFFSFLAGFTDAEGSIYISNGQAAYSLGNYNYELLNWIRENLILYGIECRKVCIDKTKGYVTKGGYVHNDNYSHLTISKKSSLLKLLIVLKRYLKHENRRRQLNAGINNINSRNSIYV